MSKTTIDYKKLKPHPLGEIFPPMGDTEYGALKKSIKTDGFNAKHQIILLDGKILDGNNRYTALKAVKANIDPSYFKEFTGENPFMFVMQENLHRRHLTPSQLATIGVSLLEQMQAADKAAKQAEKDAAKSANLQKGEKGAKGAKAKKTPKAKKTTKGKGGNAALTAKLTGASERNINAAAALKAGDPEAFQEVQAGTTTLHAASKKLAEKKEDAAKKSDALAEAYAVIDKALGDPFSEVMKKKATTKDAIQMSGLTVEEMKRVKPMIESGWALKMALGYQAASLTPAHSIRNLIERAIHAGGSFTLDVAAFDQDWIIEVNKKTK